MAVFTQKFLPSCKIRTYESFVFDSVNHLKMDLQSTLSVTYRVNIITYLPNKHTILIVYEEYSLSDILGKSVLHQIVIDCQE